MRFRLLLIAILVFTFACNQTQTPTQKAAEKKVYEKYDELFDTGFDYAGAHIVISYVEASVPNKEIDRTQAEALEKINNLLEALKRDPSIFADLAAEESDGPRAKAGGDLGFFNKGTLVPPIEKAIDATPIGEIHPEIVESKFGYHIVRRDPVKTPHYTGELFSVAFRGNPRVPATISRTKEEARVIAEEIAKTLTPENFEEMALKHNDFAKGSMVIAPLRKDTRMPLEVMENFAKLGFGEISPPIELEAGYTFFWRQHVARFSGAHILVPYKGAKRAQRNVERSKEEALARAQELLNRILESPDKFAEIAMAESEDPSAEHGGSLGAWFRGEKVKEFDNRIAELKENQIDEQLLETIYGYHIVKRLPLPAEETAKDQ